MKIEINATVYPNPERWANMSLEEVEHYRKLVQQRLDRAMSDFSDDGHIVEIAVKSYTQGLPHLEGNLK